MPSPRLPLLDRRNPVEIVVILMRASNCLCSSFVEHLVARILLTNSKEKELEFALTPLSEALLERSSTLTACADLASLSPTQQD